MAHYIICYDIADPKRLCKVCRTTRRFARFVQYSVYYMEGTDREVEALIQELSALIDNQQDDVRVYLSNPLEDAIVIGQPLLPEDIRLY